MRRVVAVALGLWAALAGSAVAQSEAGRPVVVELYTSQGCSTCPPADALLAELAHREDVIALALHVDYWDYIGWKDSFAQPSFTKRQKAYARVAGTKSVYTPQMIVQGMNHLVGVRPMELFDLIARHGQKPVRVTLTVERSGELVVITASAEPPLERGAVVQLVQYRPEATVTIEHGENAGHTLTYTNIVESWRALADWDGKSPIRLEAEVSAQPGAVIVQEPGPGPILAAMKLR